MKSKYSVEIIHTSISKANIDIEAHTEEQAGLIAEEMFNTGEIETKAIDGDLQITVEEK